MIGERLLRMASDKRLAELVTYWSNEAALARTEDEWKVCQRMLAKYHGEIERRQGNGRGGKGD